MSNLQKNRWPIWGTLGSILRTALDQQYRVLQEIGEQNTNYPMVTEIFRHGQAIHMVEMTPLSTIFQLYRGVSILILFSIIQNHKYYNCNLFW